jgi:hypothetical protein
MARSRSSMIEFENCVLSVSEKIEQWLGLKINRDKTRIYEVKWRTANLATARHLVQKWS